MVTGTLTVMLAIQTRLCGLLAGFAQTGWYKDLGLEYWAETS